MLNITINVYADVGPHIITLSCQVPEGGTVLSLATPVMPLVDNDEVVQYLAEQVGNILLNAYNLIGLTLQVIIPDDTLEQEEEVE